jgi:hypothetical protein
VAAEREAEEAQAHQVNVELTKRAIEALAAAPMPVQKAFIQANELLGPGSRTPWIACQEVRRVRWQARVNQDRRFYFKIDGDIYRISDLTPHPK